MITVLSASGESAERMRATCDDISALLPDHHPAAGRCLHRGGAASRETHASERGTLLDNPDHQVQH